MGWLLMLRPFLTWCPKGDSNPHDLNHHHLKVARLPIPPSGQIFFNHLSNQTWCPRGDSNPYGLSATATSRRRVYQFRHLGKVFFSKRKGRPPRGGVEPLCIAMRLWIRTTCSRIPWAPPMDTTASFSLCLLPYYKPPHHDHLSLAVLLSIHSPAARCDRQRKLEPWCPGRDSNPHALASSNT